MSDKDQGYRKRLNREYGTDAEWDALIKLANEKTVGELLARLNGEGAPKEEQKEWAYSGEGAKFKGQTEKPITTLEEGLAFCEADLTKYKVKEWKFKSWDVTMKLKRQIKSDSGVPVFEYYDHKRTNYGINIDFIPKVDPKTEQEKEAYERFSAVLRGAATRVKKRTAKGTEKGVAAIADLHTGANVKAVLNSPDFNMEVLIEKLKACADKINEQKLKEVTLVLLGDFVESITGLNHLNTWQELELYGSSAIIACYKVIKTCLIDRINNLKAIEMVSGNHDRLTSNRDLDMRGGAAGLLAFMLSENTEIPINYNPILISFDLDGIRYVCTHGHFKLSTKDIRGLLFEHGNQNTYNVLLEGHRHTRETKKGYKKTPIKFEDMQFTKLDTFNVRSIVCPSIFTGNFWSTSYGLTSTSGLTLIKNNGFGQINHFDFCI